jgi:hypothetical protein
MSRKAACGYFWCSLMMAPTSSLRAMFTGFRLGSLVPGHNQSMTFSISYKIEILWNSGLTKVWACLCGKDGWGRQQQRSSVPKIAQEMLSAITSGTRSPLGYVQYFLSSSKSATTASDRGTKRRPIWNWSIAKNDRSSVEIYRVRKGTRTTEQWMILIG